MMNNNLRSNTHILLLNNLDNFFMKLIGFILNIFLSTLFLKNFVNV